MILGATGDEVVEFLDWESRNDKDAKWIVMSQLNRGRGKEQECVILTWLASQLDVASLKLHRILSPFLHFCCNNNYIPF